MEDTAAVPEENITYIQGNLAFARKLAYAYYRQRENLGVELEDFIGAAELGLCDAARRYDSTKKKNFRTYAYIRIRGAMSDLLRRGGLVPRSYIRAYCAERAESENRSRQSKDVKRNRKGVPLANDTNELHQLSSVIEQMGYRMHFQRKKSVVELSYADEILPEQYVIDTSFRAYLRNMVDSLEPREREVITRRYYLGQSFDDMREFFGNTSKSWLSRLHARALENLKSQLRDDWISEQINCRAQEVRVSYA